MANTLVKINVHIIFHVKNYGVKMRNEDLGRIFSYIGGIINGSGGMPIEIGGIESHVHILTTLPKNTSLSDFVRIIKSDSSRWIKTINKHYNKFSWQEGYGAFSVSPALIDKTGRYIQNQSEHHKTMTFRDEYKSFLKAYGIECDERYIFDD
ncbi:MAG: transposase [Bacteroidales bacterium]|nr:transposase [Bacteroidales bacterium]